jgi:ribosomal protein S18 acetylase RimI-like enzyme
LIIQSFFIEFKKYSISDYAKEISKAKKITYDEAFKLSSKEINGFLSKGLDTENMYINNILLDKKKIGYLWYSITHEKAFILDIIIFENERNKGFGSKALTELQNLLKIKNVQSLGLHVFSQNKKAIKFYEKHDFYIASLNMNKIL